MLKKPLPKITLPLKPKYQQLFQKGGKAGNTSASASVTVKDTSYELYDLIYDNKMKLEALKHKHRKELEEIKESGKSQAEKIKQVNETNKNLLHWGLKAQEELNKNYQKTLDRLQQEKNIILNSILRK
ncbi:MAG: hypothetical protein [Circular genetic element sp.]|nr:MAG: hypothetical protein [Circular genetic element sp.]